MFIPFHDNNPIRRWPVVTVAIIVINVVSFAYLSGLNELAQRQTVFSYGFVPARLAQLFDKKPIRIRFQEELRQPGGHLVHLVRDRDINLQPLSGEIFASLVTCMFLHGGILHLVGNMWFFWIFGNNIEDRLGHAVFLCFYLLGGIVASLCHWAMTGPANNTIPVIGASGAVAVILGAYAVTYPNARVKVLVIFFFITVIELKALIVLGFWFLMQLLQVFTAQAAHVTSVAWWAHIGGFVTGMFVMPLLAAGIPQPGEDWDQQAKKQLDYSRGVSDKYSRGIPRDDD